jgi:hypothetical protein
MISLSLVQRATSAGKKKQKVAQQEWQMNVVEPVRVAESLSPALVFLALLAWA